MSPWVKNREIFQATKLRRDALAIIEAGLDSVETGTVVREMLEWEEESQTLCVREINLCLTDFDHVFVVSIGKCARDAARAIEGLLGDYITDGIVFDLELGSFSKLRSRAGTHPLPSEQNGTITEEIIQLLDTTTSRDLVIAVVSGGGSALLCSPNEMGCSTLALITKTLMDKGATIRELNTVRKHLSKVQGGELARLAYPATVLNLMFSDVIGDDPSIIASGPFVKDETTAAEAKAVLEKYDVLKICQIRQCKVKETPKEQKFFDNVKDILLVNNERALMAMARRAQGLGYEAKVATTELQGEAQEVGRRLAKEIKREKGNSALFYGGETTVTIQAGGSGGGKGGRNQELSLAALSSIPSDALLVSLASDGRDNTDAAGAMADLSLRAGARERGLEPEVFLKHHDSYSFWHEVPGQIITGVTGINVADLIFILK